MIGERFTQKEIPIKKVAIIEVLAFPRGIVYLANQTLIKALCDGGTASNPFLRLHQRFEVSNALLQIGEPAVHWAFALSQVKKVGRKIQARHSEQPFGSFDALRAGAEFSVGMLTLP